MTKPIDLDNRSMFLLEFFAGSALARPFRACLGPPETVLWLPGAKAGRSAMGKNAKISSPAATKQAVKKIKGKSSDKGASKVATKTPQW